MKRLFTFVITMLLGATLAFAQGTAGSTGAPTQSKTDTTTPPKKTTKATKTSKAHKGGKKSKKTGGTTTPPPK